MVECVITGAQAMRDTGASLAEVLQAGCVVYLNGELGAGKTTLVAGILRGLGYSGTVKSPTYTLLEPYAGDTWEVCHFDLYRLKNPLELENLAFRDYLDTRAMILIEWPERAASLLPGADIDVLLTVIDDTRRALSITCAHAAQEQRCSEVLAQN